ncbi:MAG: TetR/AcrR family transcriptional regulator [Chloroflexi bacterium]|nr:TetR/AcrR family transcriptional regulator [Chloroflexota bacterium]
MVRPTLKKQIPNLQEAIKETAWKQIAEFGAPALSLRAIARELKITAPAIYNYYPSRDHLVTALIVDAYTSLGDSQKSTLESLLKKDSTSRFSALGIAYRDWAVTYPQRYQLIFGTPIPDYDAPEDATTPAAAWALLPLIETVQVLYNESNLRVERLAKLTAKLKSMLEAWKQFTGSTVETEVLYTAYVVWSRVHGLVMLELGGQLPPFFTDPGEVFRREVATMINQYTGE